MPHAQTDLLIANLAMDALGEAQVTSITGADTSKAGSILNRMYDDLKDELLEMFPWRFATKRRAIAVNTNDYYPVIEATKNVWTASGSGTNEYYMLRTALRSIKAKPDAVYEDDAAMTEGTLGSLNAGEWGWGDNDTLGYSTLYVRLADGADPDSKAAADADFLEVDYTEPDSDFNWDNKLPVPGDCLRMIRMEHDSDQSEVEWEWNDGTVLTNEDDVNMVYVTYVTDPLKYTPAFSRALRFYVAWNICRHLTDNTSLEDRMEDKYNKAIATARRLNAFVKNKQVEKNLSAQRPNTSWQSEGR